MTFLLPSQADPQALRAPLAAMALLLVVAVLFGLGAPPLAAHFGEGGLVAAQVLFLLLPSLIYLQATRPADGSPIALALPARRVWVGAACLSLAALTWAWLLTWLQSFVVPLPAEFLREVGELVQVDAPRRLGWLLVLLAVTPAICEEFLFRGVLLRATTALPPWRAVLINGLVFGAFHLSVETVARFLPTAFLGGLIAWAVLRSGTLWVGVFMHFLNNGVILMVAVASGIGEASVLPELPEPSAPPPAVLLLAALLTLMGVRLVGRTGSGAPEEGKSGPTGAREVC